MKYTKILMLLLLVSCVNAAEENIETESSSWWGKTKQITIDIWDGTVESIESFSNSEEVTEILGTDPAFAEIWDKVTPALNQVLDIEKENETLPDSAWLGKDKTDNQGKINALLDEAIGFLSISKTSQIRKQIRTLEEDIRSLKQSIAKYRQSQISAPIRSKWKTTVSDYDEKIEQLNELIQQRHKEITKLKEQFSQQLAERGLNISKEQLDVLLSSVVGDDIIQSSVVYDNVKKISQQLMVLTKNSGEDIEISQRYYGMHTVLLKTLLHMQVTFTNNIDEKYIPKIAQIVEEVNNINETTRNLLSGEVDKNHRQHLMANIGAQKLTLQTAELYKKHLNRQRGKVEIAKNKTESDLQIAQNTYRTVRVSGELINLLRTSQKSFDTLLNIQVPDLLVFESLQMKQEFAILTQKLAE
ncbi:hypothetical protein QUF74_07405 [Candidatus Halobeggiatoa sp. HSG11]|nr:hypothetical protein [Candidatus Halobeggiatoa sp. HSG11]